jgi:hypothetical protein
MQDCARAEKTERERDKSRSINGGRGRELLFPRAYQWLISSLDGLFESTQTQSCLSFPAQKFNFCLSHSDSSVDIPIKHLPSKKFLSELIFTITNHHDTPMTLPHFIDICGKHEGRYILVFYWSIAGNAGRPLSSHFEIISLQSNEDRYINGVHLLLMLYDGGCVVSLVYFILFFPPETYDITLLRGVKRIYTY